MKVLNLNGCHGLTDTSFDVVVRQFPNIKQLNVQDCKELTDKNLITFEKLIHLEFFTVSHFHNKKYTNYGTRFKKLKKLHIIYNND
jgi:ribonuclease HIII